MGWANTGQTHPHKEQEAVDFGAGEAKKQLDGMACAFSEVYSQWDLPHNDPLWREKWIAKAKEWKDKVPSAKLVFDLESNH